MRGGRAAWCRKGYLRAAAKLAGDIKPKLAGPERPVVREEAESRGLWDILIFSISDSWTRFDFARRFWNQILTWVSVRLRLFENSALSAIDRYCFSWNFFSSDVSCWVVNGVLGFRLGLCFLSAHLRGPKADCAGPPGPGKWFFSVVVGFSSSSKIMKQTASNFIFYWTQTSWWNFSEGCALENACVISVIFYP